MKIKIDSLLDEIPQDVVERRKVHFVQLVKIDVKVLGVISL